MKKKVLHINCHPLFNDNTHATVQLSDYGLEFLSQIENIEINTLNLYDSTAAIIPRIDETLLSLWKKNGETPNEEESVLQKAQEKLLQQWIEADYIFIYSPLHNFNITSKFKDLVDNILIAGRTFKYTSNGSVGLLSDDKKIMYVQCSGSEYSRDFRYVNADHSTQYVRTILSFMGINQLQLIRVEGLDLRSNHRPALIDKGKTELHSCLQTYFNH